MSNIINSRTGAEDSKLKRKNRSISSIIPVLNLNMSENKLK